MPSPSSRRAWIEIFINDLERWATQSPSSRRAWIEMETLSPRPMSWPVALLAEGVDRNPSAGAWPRGCGRVALLAEGVDRNQGLKHEEIQLDGSPSSRRAWIEIRPHSTKAGQPTVALLAEGVDRNDECRHHTDQTVLSPSSRRAWIEIHGVPARHGDTAVALLAEGVDRNRFRVHLRPSKIRRPPRGGRG